MLCVIFGPPISVVLAIACSDYPVVRALVGISFGAYAIWLLVRRINQGDDPLRAKRPGDAP
jgi:hypothetical protein